MRSHVDLPWRAGTGMLDILDARNLPVLARHGRTSTLVVFSFDGALAPYTSDRHVTGLRSSTYRLLREVRRVRQCAVLSGRARSDLAIRMAGMHVHHLLGNHGIERPGADDRFVADNAANLRWLSSVLGRLQGVEIEDKRYSLTIHYRHSRTKRAALDLIDAALDPLRANARVSPGELAVEVRPARAPTRGDAVRELMRSVDAKTLVYVGAEPMDEEAFSLSDTEMLGIRVEARRGSAAGYSVRHQRALDDLLLALLRPARE